MLTPGRIEFDAVGAKLVAVAVDELAVEYGAPVLLIVDTMARALPGGADENSAKDVMQFVNAVDALRDRFGCVAVIVHHTGHGEEARGRARGSSAFRAAMDFEYLVDKRTGQLRSTKMKDAEMPDAIAFELVQVEQSAVAVFSEPVSDTRPDLTKAEELGVSTFKESVERLGRHWVTIEEWRFDFYRRHTGDTTATKRQAFHRVRESLVSKGQVRVDNDAYSLCVTCVTKRDMSREVTGGKRDNRDTTLKGCHDVTPRDSVTVNADQRVWQLTAEDFDFGEGGRDDC